MKIAIASDHRGYKLKQELISSLQEKYTIIDLGTNSEESVDFPKYGIALGETIKNKKADLGIAICGTGIGISIAVNKVKGVMCAKISNIEEAKLAKEHNNASVIALSGKTKKEEALKMIEEFLTSTPNKEEKYQRRINQIKEYENVS
ncbi:MAG: RpiB/LacA/LacB family sugar-phosphate isomerase [Bacilli bacterium]